MAKSDEMAFRFVCAGGRPGRGASILDAPGRTERPVVVSALQPGQPFEQACADRRGEVRDRQHHGPSAGSEQGRRGRPLHQGRAGADAVMAAIREQGGASVSRAPDLTIATAPDRLVRKADPAPGGLDVVIIDASGPVRLMPVAAMADEHFDRRFNLDALRVRRIPGHDPSPAQ